MIQTKQWVKYMVLASALLITTPLLADTKQQQEEVVTLVKKAAHYIKKHGKDAAIAEFNKPKGKFTHGSFYVFATDYNGVIQAHAGQPERVGRNGLKTPSSSGEYITAKLLEVAKSGGGWYKYRSKNPLSQQIECKNSYIMPMKDYYIGSGYYYAPDAKGQC